MTLQLIARAAEVKLVETLNAIEDPSGWQAIHFHLDRLREEYKSDYQIKIAINLITDLLKPYDGGIFMLADRGIVLLCNGLEKTLENKLIFQLRYLYMDDPLAYAEGGDENQHFCSVYNLEKDWREFMDLASKRMALSVRKTAVVGGRATARVGAAAEISHPSTVVDFSSARLPNVEQDIQRADLSKVIRRQPVCAVLPGGGVRKVFDELYIHIAHLRHSLKAEVDFFSNRWLFKYVTQLLDERVLEFVGSNAAEYLNAPISLNLNAATLLSQAFSDFDALTPPSTKVSVVIEVPVVDVFADITGFIVARNEVQKLGYRVCLDGLNTKSFVNIERDKLKVDLLKIQWNADAESDLKTAENQELMRAIQACGNKRIILCRCDSKQAVEYGQALGISLFQGRYIDALLDPSSTIEN